MSTIDASPRLWLRTLLVTSVLVASCDPAPGARDREGASSERDEHGEHGENEESQIVRLSAEAVERSGIRIEPVGVGNVAGAIEVPAEVRLNPDRVAHVAPLVPGQLREVRVTIGDVVEPEQALGVLRSMELGQARAAFERADAMVDVAESNFERQERLRSEGIASERSYLEAQLQLEEARAEKDATRARLQVFGVRGGRGPDMTLEAPVGGRVIERHATQGETVSPEDVLFVIADLSRVWVIGQVYEQDVAALREGMAATLTLGAYPDWSWSSELAWIGSTLDEASRTLAVRVELDSPDEVLRPGLFGTLRLEAEATTGSQVTLVPQTAVQELRGGSVVFVPLEHDGAFEAISVLTGRRSGGLVEVLEGLEPTARVVVEGAFILKSELLRGELGDGHAH